MQNTIKKNLILIVFLFCSSSILYSQGWVALNTGTNRNFNGVFFTDQNTGYITGDTTLKTTNGGQTWIFLNHAYTRSVFFNNSLTGFIGGYEGYTKGIKKTTDGGLSWQFTNFMNLVPWTICFVNNSTGWLASGIQFGGYVHKTTNGGANWFLILSDFGQLSAQFYDTNTGYTIGYYGGLKKSTDGGANWFSKTPPAGNYWICMALTDTNKIYMGSATGNICRSTDGANSWIVYQSGTNNLIFSIYFANNQTGYAVGGSQYPGNSSQIILKTTNAGGNWFQQQGVTQFALTSVHFINPNTGWAVGDSWLVIKTTNGGVVVGTEEQQSEIPQKFILYQNFPNPFNPSTTIKYDLLKEVFVKLTVIDVLGRTEKILVNENQKAGKYKVNFNANNLASGVYYYRLQAGDPSASSGQSFVETKKLVLIR